MPVEQGENGGAAGDAENTMLLSNDQPMLQPEELQCQVSGLLQCTFVCFVRVECTAKTSHRVNIYVCFITSYAFTISILDIPFYFRLVCLKCGDAIHAMPHLEFREVWQL